MTESEVYPRCVSLKEVVSQLLGRKIVETYEQMKENTRKSRNLSILIKPVYLVSVDKYLTMCLEFLALSFLVSSDEFLDLCKAGACSLPF